MRMSSDLGVLHRRKMLATAKAQLPEAQALTAHSEAPAEKKVTHIDSPHDYMENSQLGALTWDSFPQAGVLGGFSFTTVSFMAGATIGWLIYDQYREKKPMNKRLVYAAKWGAGAGVLYAAAHGLTMAGQRGIIPGSGE